MQSRRRIWHRRCVWALGIALSAWAVCGPGLQLASDERLGETCFHGDEAFGLAQTYFFDLYFLDRDWHDQRWFDDYLSLDQPHIGHYLLGWGLYRAGLARPPNKLYDFGLDRKGNLDEGRVPSDEALLAARKVMASFGAATIGLVALLGLVAGRPLTGALAAWLLSQNELFVVAVSRAMQDAPLLAFTSAATVLLIAGFRLISGSSLGRKIGGLVVLVPAGICSGLAMGSKLNGLISLAFAVLVALLILLQGGAKTWYRRLWLCAGMYGFTVVPALATFYWTHPYLCSYPQGESRPRVGLARGLRDLITWRAVISAGQREEYSARAIPPGLAAHARMVGARAFAVDPGHTADGVTYATLARLTGLRLDGLLYAGGGVLLLASAMGSYRLRRQVAPPLLVLLWALFSAAAVTFWIPLDWDRYYLPIIVPAQLLIAAGLAAPLEWWLARSSKPAPAEVTCGR